MNTFARPFSGFLVVLMLISFSSQARASNPIDVAVLNLESSQVDVAALASLTAVLRDEASQVASYNVSKQPPISISELAIVLGCDHRQNDCLEQVADYLETQVLIFGTTSHQDDTYHVTVDIFDAKSTRIIHSFSRDFDSNQNLTISFRREISAFLSNPKSIPTSRLEISSNVSGADIRLDGVLVGHTPFERLGLPAGNYHLEISAPGFETWSTTVTLTDSGEAKITAPMTAMRGYVAKPAGDPTDRVANSTNWGAWSAIGVGSLALGASGAMAWMMNDTEQEIASKRGAGLTQREHQALIDQGNSYQLSHLVLLGVGAVGVTSGVIWLLVDGMSNNGDADLQAAASPLQFNLTPSSVSATWRW